MSDEMMKILQMLEEGKITAQDAHKLLSVISESSQKAPTSDQPSTVGSRSPSIPLLPDIGKIVNDALREAFSEVERELENLNIAELVGTATAQGVRFAGARLSKTNLMDARMDNSTRFEGANLEGTVFVDADLRGADLRNANLSFSNFTDANLRHADLRGANMSHSNFVDANLANADLRGANLSHGKYTDADFSDCDLEGADLSQSNLSNADFRGVRQRGLQLHGVNMPGIRYDMAPTSGTEPDTAESEEQAEDDIAPPPSEPAPDAPESGGGEQAKASQTPNAHDAKPAWPWSLRRHRAESEESPSSSDPEGA